MPEKAKVFFIDKNIHGAFVVYGSEGVKQYYGCTIRHRRRKNTVKKVRRLLTGG